MDCPQKASAAIENTPGGPHIFLEEAHPNVVKIIAIGYRYNLKVPLRFVATKDGRSTRLGKT